MAELINRTNRKLNRDKVLRSRAPRPQGWRPPNSIAEIDPNILGPDVVIRWIRKFVTRSEEDLNTLFKRSQRGWVPVKQEEIPALKHLSDPEGNIASNGCILCKADREAMQHDVEFWEDLALGYSQSANKEYETSDKNSALPKFSTSKTKGFVGRLPGK